MSQFWDQRFAEPGYKYGTAPNAFLRAESVRLPPAARVLVPGDGEGRNSVWLAQQGHMVLAMDASAVGLGKARALAAERGVAIHTEQGDLADWTPTPEVWDALVLVYVHLPSAIRAEAHRRLVGGLRPGGLVVLEAFRPAQLGRTSGGPKDLDMLYPLADLRVDFEGWCDEVFGHEGEVLLDEGPGHQGAGCVTRYIGRRRA